MATVLRLQQLVLSIACPITHHRRLLTESSRANTEIMLSVAKYAVAPAKMRSRMSCICGGGVEGAGAARGAGDSEVRRRNWCGG